MNKYGMKLSLIALAITAGTAGTAQASDSDFYGYGRAGLSTTADGGEQACYGNGAAGHFTGRLGDECDTYVEMGLNKTVYENDGQSYLVDTMISYQTADGAQRNDWQSVTQPDQPDSLGNIALRQFNLQASGIFDSIPEATLWAGKRFYQRKDVALLDLFYLNNSGYGIGLEGISMGAGELSLAWMNADHDSSTGKMNANGWRIVEQNKLDIRYGGLNVAGGVLDLAGIYGMVDLTDVQDNAGEGDDDGYFLTAELKHELLGGYNKIVLQYGADALGAAAWENASGSQLSAATMYQGDLKDSFRILDFGSINLSDNWELAYSALYQQASAVSSNAPNDTAERISVVVSPSYKWSEKTKTTLEIGYDDVQETDEFESIDLQKVVVAQEWTVPAGNNSTIRVYAGSFFGEQAETRRTGNSEGDDGNIRFGAQVVAAW